MKNKDIYKLLNSWTADVLKQNKNLRLRYATELHIGQGIMKHDTNQKYNIQVGISPFSQSIRTRNQIVDDLIFVKIGITTFHELGHYDQITTGKIDRTISNSDLSKAGNNYYYRKNWSVLPHEIDAEYTGVMSMWSKLQTYNSNTADDLIIQHLTNRAANTKYVIQIPKNGFQTREQIEILFEEAYERALTSKRIISSGFLRSDDEIAQMITDENQVLHRDYYPFYHQLTSSSGEETDRKMASLVTFLHPELQPLYPNLNFSDLDPQKTFGCDMPETREEILSRIRIQNTDTIFDDSCEIQEFIEAVDKISDLEGQSKDIRL